MARCMARTSELQDFNRGTMYGQGGLPMAAMLGPGGTSVVAILGPGDRVCADHRWHDGSRTNIAMNYNVLRCSNQIL